VTNTTISVLLPNQYDLQYDLQDLQDEVFYVQYDDQFKVGADAGQHGPGSHA
jgi:hypothetical protein